MTIVAGTEILVSTTNAGKYTEGSQQITALADGGFAVTWYSSGDIRGRVFAADGTPVNGSDFLVSTTNAGAQTSPQITALADGGFAVTWESNGNFDIRGRVFAADGTPVNSSDFSVSTANAGAQEYEQITALADGGFAVTWTSSNNNDADIRGRVFAADGTPVNGSDFLVSTTNAGSQYGAPITALADGGFAVTWQSLDSGNYDIRGRVFAADGTPVNGSDFLVSTTNAGGQYGAPITALADGGFAVTWQSFDNGSVYDDANPDIRGRVFAADGTPVNGSDFLVSTTNVDHQQMPQITTLAGGGFAVTWTSRDNGSNFDVRGRVFAADGTPVNGSDFLISTANAGTQQFPQITALADGGFAVTWESFDNGSNPDIRGRVFAADGSPINGSDFLVPTTNAGDQTSPQITALADGGFAVTWNSSDSGIRAKVFAAINDAPTIASNGAGAAASVSVAENTTAVTTVTATDPDVGQTLNYSIIGGADASKFTIGSSTGALSFVTAPNFELPADAGGNNVYDVIVQASDGHGGVDTQAIAVGVQNVVGASIHGSAGNDVIDMTHTVAGQPFPTTEEDTLNGRGGSDTLAGGPGADTFVFDPSALTAQPGSGIVDHILDYNQGNSGIFNPAEGDTFDFSALLSAVSGQPVDHLVRVLENPSGTAAILQIDQDGAVNGAHWTTIAQLDGVHTGDAVKIVMNGGATANITSTLVDHAGFVQPSFELAAFAPGAGGWSSDNLYKRELADVNGDGMADIVGFGQAGVYVSQATGNGHFAAPTFELAQFAPGAGGWSSDDLYKRELADVNGDGMADIVGFGQAGVYVSQATGNGHFAAPTFELAQFAPGAGGWSNDNLYTRELADVNGDGMADIVGFGQAGVYVSQATGNGHFAAPTFELAQFAPGAGGWSNDNLYTRELADVNGDGMADIVGFGQAGVYVSQATGNGHFAAPTFELAQFAPGAGGWSSDDLYKRELADVNGDGMADIVGFGQAGVYVSQATGNGHFAAPTFELAQFAPGAGGWSSDDLYTRELADVNGDGMADIVGFGQAGVYVSQAHDFHLI